MNIGAFLPQFAEDAHPGLQELDLGILFAIYQITFLITAPLAGAKMHLIGRRRTVLISILLMAVATTIFGLAAYFKKTRNFYTVSMMARAIQGAAAGFMEVAVPSIIAIQFPAKNELYQGYAVMAMGIGLTLGPIIGVVVYRWLSYAATMYFFAGLILLTGLLAIAIIPAQIDSKIGDHQERPNV
jgi:MFS family permease